MSRYTHALHAADAVQAAFQICMLHMLSTLLFVLCMLHTLCMLLHMLSMLHTLWKLLFMLLA